MESPTLTCTASPASPPRGLSPRAQIVVMTCACAGASAFLFAVDPSRHAVYPQCLLYNTTGLYCAGCGATRALYALLHGRVLTALHDNVLFVALLPLLIYVTGSHALKAWRADAWPPLYVNAGRLMRFGVCFFILIAGFMILRNLPGWPFDWFKPLP